MYNLWISLTLMGQFWLKLWSHLPIRLFANSLPNLVHRKLIRFELGFHASEQRYVDGCEGFKRGMNLSFNPSQVINFIVDGYK